MNFNPMNFITNLSYMLKGMIGIFVVIGVIILITVLLNKFTGGKK
ncbi:MAG: oxaloacetate decarboxylase [Clostridia bacterium]|nr:oxaloacetate decarboxylase [Clostridia bacterium]